MLLAAIGHDLDHPGLPNSYLSKVEHLDPLTYYDLQKSEQANKVAYLENHHTKVLLNLLQHF